MAFAERAPDGRVLGTEQGDDGRADGGGDVHGAAVVTEEDVELREERGELADGKRAVEGDDVGFRVSPDFGDERLFGGAGDEEDLGAEFVLEAVGDGGKTVGGPEAEGAAAAGVDEDFSAAARRDFLGDGEIGGRRGWRRARRGGGGGRGRCR